MQATIDTTNKHREKQMAYNIKHHITPKTIKKNIITSTFAIEIDNKILNKEEKDITSKEKTQPEKPLHTLNAKELDNLISSKTKTLEQAVKDLDFINAASLRDELQLLKEQRKKLKNKLQD